MLNVEILFEELQKMTKKGKKGSVFIQSFRYGKKAALGNLFFCFFLSSNI